MSEQSSYSRRAVFAAACAGMLVFGIFLTTLGSILPLIIQRFGIQKGEAGSLLMLMNLGVLGGSLVFGPVVDRYGFKIMLIVSSLVIFAGIEGVALAGTINALRGAVFVAGLAAGVINGGTNALVADISTGSRGAGLSLLGIFFGLGAFGVPFTLSFLIDHYDYSEIIGGVGATVIAPLVFFAAVRFPAPKQPRGFPFGRGLGIVRNPAMLLVAFMLLLQSGIEVSTGGWAATYFVDELSVEPGMAVLYLSCFWAGLTLGRLFVGAFLNAMEPFRVLIGSIAVGGSGLLLMLLSDYAVVAGAGIFIAGLGFAAVFPYLLGILGDLFPDISGTAFGIAFAIALVGGSFFPYLIGVLGESVGLRASLALIPVNLLIIALLLRRLKVRVSHPETTD